MNNDDDIIELPITLENDDSVDITEYKFLIGTEHIDSEDSVLYRTVDVLEEESVPTVGPLIVADRRVVKPNGNYHP